MCLFGDGGADPWGKLAQVPAAGLGPVAVDAVL